MISRTTCRTPERRWDDEVKRTKICITSTSPSNGPVRVGSSSDREVTNILKTEKQYYREVTELRKDCVVVKVSNQSLSFSHLTIVLV